MPDNVYIYYSGATDKTGALLAEALEIQGGTKKPAKEQQIVIGWGAKTKESVNLGKATVINHPNAIKVNRNKLTALQLMQKAKVNVAPFAPAESVMGELGKKSATLGLPLVGRTNYHQGGRNFWTCLTQTHVKETIGILNGTLKKKGYFQNYIDIEAEFRLHVVNGEVIYAQRKVPRSNMKEAHVSDQMDKIQRMADKKGVKVDAKTLEFAMGYQGDKLAGPDLVIKSNTKGYKFSSVKLSNVNKALADEAIKAVAAIGLEFGAVDCALDTNKKAWIIEVNTGPGLEGTAFKNYVGAFSKMINEILTPKKATATPKTTAGKKASTTAPKKAVASKIDPEKLRMLAEMLENADPDEADAVQAVASRMFGNG